MSGEIIITIFLLRELQKLLPENSPFKSSKISRGVMYVAIILIAVDITSLSPVFSKWIAHIILLAVIFYAYKVSHFRSLRYGLLAVMPFALVAFIKEIIGLFHNNFTSQIHTYLAIIYPCTIVWMIAMFFIYRQQVKALKKEKQKREIEEEQNRIIKTRKAELEEMVTERTAELLKQKEELELTLSELQNTQAQLIQSEKMASLGELTAGIAHEIQNPLNFVNNFSDVNKELIEEMELEIRNGNLEEVQAIANDIKENELKINQHGKRADAIVKGMLQHSRKSTGQKELTDINALADEYLRLSYHGLRAKDKLFNAIFKMDFDETISSILVIPQDISRVLLNLFNNAFYAVNERKKLTNGGFEPTVSVATKKLGDIVEICVKDNGIGIPQKVLDKIYQPFFTTKPAGQGTGLGLSMSYDIIKAHGGELEVKTKEGEGAEFIIQLPIEKDNLKPQQS